MDHMDSEIQNWYLRLRTQTLDLVGDYAGKELFLLEGDSLLLQCFGDPKIEFEDFELLHVVYIVERFLESLVRRLCNFHLIFFHDHADMCIPPHHLYMKNRYLLARSVILRHLTCLLPQSHPKIKIHSFCSLNDPTFKEYLVSSGTYFIMCHDGARAANHFEIENSAEGASYWNRQKSTFRRMIGQFMSLGFNVALINGLEIKDTKVMAMILYGKHKVVIPLGNSENHIRLNSRSSGPLQTETASASPNKNSDCLSTVLKRLPLGIPRVDELAAALTERLALVVIVLSQLSAERPTRAYLVSAFLLHAVLLSHLPLPGRRMKKTEVKPDEFEDPGLFLNDFAFTARSAIDSSGWKQHIDDSGAQCDLANLIDERLFLVVLSKIQGCANAKGLLPEIIVKEFDYFASIITSHSGIQVQISAKQSLTSKTLLPPPDPIALPFVLPFSNVVFDQHLASLRIDIKARDSSGTGARSTRIFKEITHWHNSKRPLDTKATRILSDWQKKRLLKSNQRHMDEMLKYAASLTKTSGKILDPKTITVQKENKPSSSAGTANAKETKNISDVKKSRTAKSTPVSKAKKIIQENINSKKNASVETAFSSWANMIEILDKIVDPYARYRNTLTYLEDLVAEKREVLTAEITLYSLQPLLEIWSGFCRADKRETGYKIAALIWNQIKAIWKVEIGLTKTIMIHTSEISRLIGFPIPGKVPTETDRRLTFALRVPPTLSTTLSVGMSSQEFQLVHCGPYMDRNMDSQPDARVPFKPDGWQRAVLDELDANNSVFVVAPTSAGKTFISFYAMEKILRADDDGVLVYVAPTKALVNQIAAEVQARFSKTFKHDGKCVWAMHTRDHRVNDPTSCQILVTVPHILQIMLLAPSNAKTWATRVKCIIFDEIHSIGQADDGVVWEQLLLLAPCPIIALSATVGNPEQFNDWLAATQHSSGLNLTMIQHHHRYSDLRKFMYSPSSNLEFEGLEKRSTLGNVGLDGIPEFGFVHPISSLVNRSRGMPVDLALEARDCFSLWQTMTKHQTSCYKVPEEMSPQVSCPQTIAKVDIINWEKDLKTLLSSWMLDPNSPFDKVQDDLSAPLKTPLAHLAHRMVEMDGIDAYLRKTALPLVTELYKQNALPAILFNFDRLACEKIAKAILSSLERAEESWKNGNAKWKSLMEGYEQWKAKTSKNVKVRKDIRSKKKNKDGDEERLSKAETEKESAEQERSKYESFDPNEPCEGFSFAVPTKVETAEIEDYFKKMEWRGVSKWLMRALRRGIAVHHAGMNRHYRQTVEVLFRKGYLTVVIATGTLALGINMPCKTVVFSGDSVFLTALNFRQCAGRAGRRGFDILGNVVFHGISQDKACRLLSSRLPDLNGHFPMTTSLVLRLCLLLHESKNSTYARRAINSLLSQPRLYLGGDSFRDQVLHHVRFSIEYLRRQHLLGPGGEPINFTSCISHLYYTGNSSFAFHALLKAGYFHSLCAGIHVRPKRVLTNLMMVMAHLFGRRPCRISDAEKIKKSSSIIILPELPTKAATILEEHNEETLETFTNYVKTFAKQHVMNVEQTLPLTGLSFGGSDPTIIQALDPLPATTACSHFVALSGHSDKFDSIADLCASTRSDIFLEESVIPYLDIPSAVPLNAYLYDFFRHGVVQQIETANGIRRGEIWFLLNDFAMVLATIVTSLTNFMKAEPMDVEASAPLSGRGDASDEESSKEEVADEPSIEEDESDSDKDESGSDEWSDKPLKPGKSAPAKPRTPTRKVQKKAVPDSWDSSEAESEEDPIAGNTNDPAADDCSDPDECSEDSDGPSTEGLMNVLVAMRKLQAEFDAKFKAMWA